MTRNLKMLGLALVAAFAMSGVAASAVQAESFWFTSDGTPTTLTGSQIGEDVIGFDFGELTCETVTYSGSITGTTSTTATLTPTYGGCEVSGIPAVVHMNGCDYLVHTHTKIGTSYTVTTDIVCPTTTSPPHLIHEITVTAIAPGGTLKCTFHIPDQAISTGVTLTKATKANGKTDLTIAVNVSSIGYNETTTGTSGTGACQTADSTTNGTYVGTETIEGRNSTGGETSISVSP
jgi:hypothetical protein